MVPAIDVEEVRTKRMVDEIRYAESKHVDVEPLDVVDASDMQDSVAHAERPGSESRNWPTWPHWRRRNLWSAKHFEAIARRIVEADRRGHCAKIGIGGRDAANGNLCGLDASRNSIELARRIDLPAERVEDVRI